MILVYRIWSISNSSKNVQFEYDFEGYSKKLQNFFKIFSTKYESDSRMFAVLTPDEKKRKNNK